MMSDTITIGPVKFTLQERPKFRGDPRCVLVTDGRGRASVRFNAVLLEAFPALAACEAFAVYIAADKPAVVLVPSADGAKVRNDGSGAKIVSGMPFRALAAKYARVSYRVEAIDKPIKGWLLTPTESEKHNRP